MRLHRIEIEGFRGIRHLSMDFNASACSVLVGENGCGKSSVLDMIALLLAPFVEAISGDVDTGSPPFQTRDFFGGESSCVGRVELSFQDFLVEFEVIWTHDGSAGGKRRFDSDAPIAMHKALEETLSANPDAGIPVIAYYPSDRYVLDTSGVFAQEWVEFDQYAVYTRALSNARMDFQEFFKWFRFREDLENEHRIEDASYRDVQLEAVRNAITKLYIGFSQPRIRRNPPQMRLMKRDDHTAAVTELHVEQLSAGEKCLLTMVGDIARRLAAANPSMEQPLHGEGLVLIDEIELHLHPKWQRMIIPALTRVFPNCRFIVSTHSPQVMSEITTESIFLLSDSSQGIQAEGPLKYYGKDTNRILEELGVGERPQEIQELLRAYFSLIDSGRMEEAHNMRDILETRIGEDEPELARADVLARAREILAE